MENMIDFSTPQGLIVAIAPIVQMAITYYIGKWAKAQTFLSFFLNTTERKVMFFGAVATLVTSGLVAIFLGMNLVESLKTAFAGLLSVVATMAAVGVSKPPIEE
jgi:hypothetical protein